MDLQNRAEAGSDGHDESVLNPEMPNETDLTKKERRRIEREKLKGMGTGKKIQYIWMYYKIHMLCVLLAIGGVCLGVNIYRHAQMCSCDCCGGNVWIWNEDLSEIEEFMVFSYLCAVILYQNMLKYPLLISHSTHPEDAGKATGISRFRVKNTEI